MMNLNVKHTWGDPSTLSANIWSWASQNMPLAGFIIVPLSLPYFSGEQNSYRLVIGLRYIKGTPIIKLLFFYISSHQ
jgi:hypothetical protein